MNYFSIVTINFNNLKGLIKTCKSVFNQQFDSFEFIVIDGNSTDGSVDYLYAQKSIDVLKIEPDFGIYDAMNKGIELASGKFLWFLNSGDIFENERTIEKIHKKIISLQSEPSVIYGNVRANYLDGYTRIIKASETGTMWKQLPFSHQSVICLTSLYKKYCFNLKFKIIADQAFFYNLLLDRAVFYKLNIIFAQIEAGGKSEQFPYLVFKEKIILLKATKTYNYFRHFKLIFSFISRSLVLNLKKQIPSNLIMAITKKKY